MKESDLMLQWLAQHAVQLPETEHRFHRKRKWRFDYAWPDRKVALEIEGGVYTRGAHGSVSGILRDIEKYNTATAMGWKVFRATPGNAMSLDILNYIREALEGDRQWPLDL